MQKSGVGVVLCGDARFDSPGFSAKFMTYFIQVLIFSSKCNFINSGYSLGSGY